MKSIYMGIFVELKGMKILRNFQRDLITHKKIMPKIDFNEIKYLISLIIFAVYKHYKDNDDLEINNPFVSFEDKKMEGFKELLDISLKMDTDLINDFDLDDNMPLETLIHSTIVHKKLLVKIFRKIESLLDEEFGNPDKKEYYDLRFLKIMNTLSDNRVSKKEFFEED